MFKWHLTHFNINYENKNHFSILYWWDLTVVICIKLSVTSVDKKVLWIIQTALTLCCKKKQMYFTITFVSILSGNRSKSKRNLLCSSTPRSKCQEHRHRDNTSAPEDQFTREHTWQSRASYKVYLLLHYFLLLLHEKTTTNQYK